MYVDIYMSMCMCMYIHYRASSCLSALGCLASCQFLYVYVCLCACVSVCLFASLSICRFVLPDCCLCLCLCPCPCLLPVCFFPYFCLSFCLAFFLPSCLPSFFFASFCISCPHSLLPLFLVSFFLPFPAFMFDRDALST